MNDTVIKSIAAASGVQADRVREIADRVIANNRTLDACPRHRFVRIEEGGEANPFRVKYRCEVCGGKISGQAHHWWLRGLSDGGVAR